MAVIASLALPLPAEALRERLPRAQVGAGVSTRPMLCEKQLPFGFRFEAPRPFAGGLDMANEHIGQEPLSLDARHAGLGADDRLAGRCRGTDGGLARGCLGRLGQGGVGDLLRAAGARRSGRSLKDRQRVVVAAELDTRHVRRAHAEGSPGGARRCNPSDRNLPTPPRSRPSGLLGRPSGSRRSARTGIGRQPGHDF